MEFLFFKTQRDKENRKKELEREEELIRSGIKTRPISAEEREYIQKREELEMHR